MIKITDPKYFLPTIQALAGSEIMQTGTNSPQLLRGVCMETGEKSNYVVKYSGAERMYAGAFAKELLGICIANQLGLNVPEPVQINISKEFVDTLQGNSIYDIASKSIGFNFGSSYLSSLSTFSKEKRFNEKQWLQIPNIFAFDMFIQNADRNYAKPNMITDGENIYLFDHEMAFGFVQEIPVNKTPWIIRDMDMQWVSNHFFYPYLVSTSQSFNTFTSNLDALDVNFWQKMESITPLDWKTGDFYRILDGLQATLANKDEFIDQIKRRLQ